MTRSVILTANMTQNNEKVIILKNKQTVGLMS